MRVAMVILDGLSPRHVSPSVTPVLAALDGLHTVGQAVMTSATYPNHATFMTGASPAEHGLVANWVLDGGRPRPAHKVGVRVPTLFDRCRARSRRSAAVLGDHHLVAVMGAHAAGYHWPPDGHLPDDAERDPYGYASDAEVVRQVAEVPDWDFLVVHLNEPDTAAHMHGPDSDEALEWYGRTDTALGRVIESLPYDDLVLIVLSDHDQQTVDATAEPVRVAPRPGTTLIPEGSGAVIWGPDPAQGAWLDDVDGVAGHATAAPDVRVVWATPGRVFALPAGMDQDQRGHHGGIETRDQVVAVSGGHPAVADVAASVAETPGAATWAPLVAQLLDL